MMEGKIETKDWSFRVHTLLSMCIVDSWLLYSGVQEGHRGAMTQRDFYTTLATELLTIATTFPMRGITMLLTCHLCGFILFLAALEYI